MSCLNNPRWRQTVFSVASREYQWIDVFLAAMIRGDWREFERPVIEGLACAAEANETTNAWPADGRIDEAATAFRYARDLLTTDETMAWLAQAGISLEDWTDFLARRLLREKWADRLDELVARHGETIEVHDATFAAEGLGSECFHQFAATLAGRAAVSALLADAEHASEPGGAFRIARVVAAHATWLGALDSIELAARMKHLARLEAQFDGQAQAAKTDRALTTQLARHRLEWIRVDLERLSFNVADAAREAACCVREDGLSMSDVALESRQAVRDTREILERLEPELRDAVLSASLDELIGPIAVGDRFEVALLVGKKTPALDDPLVRARAEQAVIEQLVSKAVLAHVRWVERPRTQGGA